MRFSALLFTALLLGAVLSAGALAPPASAAAAPARLYPALADIRWNSDSGEPLSFDALKGQIVVMTMGYSGCRKTCSTSVLVLKELQGLLDRLGKQAQFIVVTYDPAGDTPQAWKQYRQSRDLNRANWHFLSGTTDDTRRVARMLDLNYWSYDEHIMHDFRIVIFDRDGRWHKEIVWQTQKDLDHLFDDL